MPRPRFHFPFTTLLHYLLAILTVAGMTGILYLLRNALDTPIVALLYLLPVGLSTALWGLGPGVAAAFCAFFTFNYFFIPPYYTLLVHRTQDILALVIFFVVAVTISQLVGRAQSSLTKAQAREREATYLYELSTALAGLRNQDAVTHILVERLREVFEASAAEIVIQPAPQGALKIRHAPAHAARPTLKPTHVIPLTTARGLLGEIHLWRDGPPLSPTEERLLRTFASQGALALERAVLAQAETRAQVLEESDRLKSALLSSVSHELRTPLATIKAAATSLRGDEVAWENTSAREDLLAAITDEADHLNRLVGNLLDMSRIEAGALKPKREWNLLTEIVGGVLARMRMATEGHRIEIAMPEDLPLVPVDYVQIEQVFTNLLSNSLKYAPSGTLIRIRARVQDNSVLVQVSNQGPPVPTEHLHRIFDKFYRVTAADRVTGTGLGLSICKGIVEAHGGRIWAENLTDGFAFNFTLPLTWEGTPPPKLPTESEAA
jgi:two-component system sensor histidine kinase KdpD